MLLPEPSYDPTPPPTQKLMFECLDMTKFLKDHKQEDYPSLRPDGVSYPVFPGMMHLPDDSSKVLAEFWNWGYTVEPENRFSERLHVTMRKCFAEGYRYAIVNTIERWWALDYHVIGCATSKLFEAAQKEEYRGGCESFVPSGDVEPFRSGSLRLSRGAWYNSHIAAVYDLCVPFSDYMTCQPTRAPVEIPDHLKEIVKAYPTLLQFNDLPFIEAMNERVERAKADGMYGTEASNGVPWHEIGRGGKYDFPQGDWILQRTGDSNVNLSSPEMIKRMHESPLTANYA